MRCFDVFGSVIATANGVRTPGLRRLAVDPSAHVARPVILITGAEPSRGPRHRRFDRYVGVNGFVFRADGLAREIRWLPDEAYLDLLSEHWPKDLALLNCLKLVNAVTR